MANDFYNLNNYKLLYDVVTSDTGTREILMNMLSCLDDSLAETVINTCIQTVAVYEHLTSIGLCDNLWESFIKKLDECENGTDELISPSCFEYHSAFKLKCIVTIYECISGDYASMAEAVYKTCSSEDYKTLEKAIINAEEKNYVKNIKNIFGCMILFAVALSSEVFCVPAIIWGIKKLICLHLTPEIHGKIALICNYGKNKIASYGKTMKYEIDSGTDYSQEYFDPTYVNM